MRTRFFFILRAVRWHNHDGNRVDDDRVDDNRVDDNRVDDDDNDDDDSNDDDSNDDDIDIKLQANIKSSPDHFSCDLHSSLGKDSWRRGWARWFLLFVTLFIDDKDSISSENTLARCEQGDFLLSVTLILDDKHSQLSCQQGDCQFF